MALVLPDFLTRKIRRADCMSPILESFESVVQMSFQLLNSRNVCS